MKRKNETIFMHVEPSDSFATVKAKCGEVYGVPPSSVGLFLEDQKTEVMDLSTISDLEISNDAVLTFVLKKPGKSRSECASMPGLIADF